MNRSEQDRTLSTLITLLGIYAAVKWAADKPTPAKPTEPIVPGGGKFGGGGASGSW
jgi:hypothetical protein